MDPSKDQFMININILRSQHALLPKHDPIKISKGLPQGIQ